MKVGPITAKKLEQMLLQIQEDVERIKEELSKKELSRTKEK